jgi:sulfite exporter TauE/SafE
MLLTAATTALLMGLAGGPHCVAMCGAACGALTRAPAAGGVSVVRLQRRSAHNMARFQAGRLLGYAASGALAGWSMQGLGNLSSHTAVLQPVWTLLHLAILAWGLVLLTQARQPAWLEVAGRGLWARVQPWVDARGGRVAAGALWTFMPCGLLYSALLVSALAGGPLEGATSMALFAMASGVSLGLAPSALRWLQSAAQRLRAGSGTRIAGALLALSAAAALWMDVARRVADWCAT